MFNFINVKIFCFITFKILTSLDQQKGMWSRFSCCRKQTDFIVLLLIVNLQSMSMLMFTEYVNVNIYRAWLLLDIHKVY